jgi:hypothetical protein
VAADTTVLYFTTAARRLGMEAHRHGLTCPGFRSPPRIPGARRTIRWFSAGAVVAVAIKDRPVADVVADMVDGVVKANRLSGSQARTASRALIEAAEPAAS